MISKAVAVGAAYLFGPFWVYAGLGAYFYFVPSFQSLRFLFPFLLTFLLALALPQTVLGAALMTIIFFLLLGIKDLIFIDRLQAGKALFIVFSFALAERFFNVFGEFGESGASFWALVLAVSTVLLLKGLLAQKRSGEEHPAPGGRNETVLLGVVTLVLSELAVSLLLIPLGAPQRIALFIIVSLTAGWLAVESSVKAVPRSLLLASFYVFFASAVLLLTLNEWGF